MSKTSPGMAKRLGAGLLATSLGVLGIALANPAGATATVTTERLAGQTRYGTAAEVAKAAYPSGSDRVIIATGENFPDALAASGLAGKLNAPVLLTKTASLSDEAKAEITALKSTKATILGGTSAVSAAVQTQLTGMGLTVDRIAGNDRYETASAVATAIGTKIRAIVASGEVAADALAAGPIAADQEHTSAPILLVKVDSVPASTKSALAGVPDVTIVGGTARISAATATAVQSDSSDSSVERVAGADRQATARLVAEWAGTHFAWDPTSVILAAPRAPGASTAAAAVSNDFSPDALVAGPLGGLRNAPVLIVRDKDTTGTDVDTYIGANKDTIATVTGAGGTAVLSDALMTKGASDAKTGASGTQTFTVPQTTEKHKVTTSPSNVDARTCIVTGIPQNSAVDVRLVPTADVTINTDGTVTLVDSLDSNNVYDETSLGGAAAIVNVNGTNLTPPGSQEVNDTIAGVGAISVSFVGYAPTDVMLLVWQDQSGLTSNATDLTVPASPNALPKTPREAFGVGCHTVFFNEAATGAVSSDDITSVAKDQDVFSVSGGQSYFYDSNDVLQIDSTGTCNQVTFAQFETALSTGDFLEGTTYNQNRDLPSTLCIEDSAPDAPGAPNTGSFLTPQGTSVKLAFNESDTATVDLYNVYRVIRPASGTCPDFNTTSGKALFTKIGSVTDTSPATDTDKDFTFTDSNLQLNTFYCYGVTSSDDGSESAGHTGNVNTGSTVDTGAPTITDARATDNGVVGIVDSGDVHRFIFSEPMAATTDDVGQSYRLQDGDATPSVVTISCIVGNGNDAVASTTDCGLNAAPVVINGTTYAAGRVLTVNLGTDAGITQTQAGTIPGVSYPATITNVSAGWTDTTGNVLSLATGDKTMDVASFTTGP